MYNWSTDEEKFKRNCKSYRVWMKYKKETEKAILSLLKSKWIKGGKVYVWRKQEGMIRYSPIMILNYIDENIPKYDYVGLSFNFDDEISRNISYTDNPKGVEKSRNYRLIGSFNRV